MGSLLQDVRYAVRGLARAPGFTAATLLTLAIGTGANATVFSLVDALLWRPAPVVLDPPSLYSVFTSDFSSGPYGATSYPDYLTLRDEVSAFSAMAAYSEGPAVLRHLETTERVRVMAVSSEFFPLLGLRPALGRVLDASDYTPEAGPALLISHYLWERLFGADPAVLGRVVALNGQAGTIVGVAPARFDGLHLGAAVDAWRPLSPQESDATARGNRGLAIVARLREGPTAALAQVQLDAVAARLAHAFPATNMGTLRHPDQPRPMLAVRHSRMHPQFRGMVRMMSAVLLSTVALVLIVACANVAGLLLARTAARGREIGTRAALGASRLRLLRQLLTESLLLGIAGGVLGILLALWTSDVLPSFFPAEQTRLLEPDIDLRVLWFTGSISLAAGLLFGLAPALQVVRPGAVTLRAGAEGTSERRTGIVRAGLVVAQMALAFVLLVACGLLVRSVSNALNADLGFTTRNAVLATIEIPQGQLTAPQGARYFDAALARVRALPGIEAASLVRSFSLTGGSRRAFAPEGYTPRPGEDLELHVNVVDAQYFATMGVRVLDGRAFDGRDAAESAPVVIVNDLLAQRYFDGRALGRRLRERGGRVLEIVGVVRSGPHRSVQEPPVPVVFYPLPQSYTPRMTLVARTAGDPIGYVDVVRRAVQPVNRSVAVFRATTLEAHLVESLGAERLTAALATASGAMTLTLAVVGLYGVIAYGVVRRKREIGVRMALGARPMDVVRLVVREGMAVTVWGIGLGVAAALAATRLIAALLYGVSPWDVATYAGAAVALTAIGALAAWIPAHRAVRLDPVAALRQE